MVTAAENALADAVGDWLAAHDRGLTETEKADFEAWLKTSPTHAAAWAKVSEVWSSYDETPDPLLESWRKAALAARPEPWRLSYRQAAAAAVIVLGAGALIALSAPLWPGARPSSNVQTASVAAVVYETGTTRRDIVLADGTSVALDARSSVSIRQNAEHRDVALLSGRAFFKVAHESARPFVVTVAGQTVTDTGTAFQVWLRPSGVAVILAEGRVTIRPSANRPTLDLKPGQLYVGPTGGPVSVETIDVERALAWRGGFVEFKATPLAEAVTEMNRYAIAPIAIDDGKAGALRISGRYQTDDASGFARSVAEIYGLAQRRDPDGQIHLSSR